ncbi:nitrilase family protein [Botrytis cinerea]
MSQLLKKPVKIALIQLASGSDKSQNLAHAREKVLEAASAGAKIIVLPECFNSPYGTQYFPKYADTLLPSPPTSEQSPSFHALSAMAAETKTYLVGGSIPEYSPTTKDHYNTSLTFSPSGELEDYIQRIGGSFPGNHVTMIDLPEYGKIAVAICYDVRFPELAMIAARKGCFALIYPGAFNTTTGPLHWRLQGQARAMDNQIYVALCSPARDETASYHAWGTVLVEAEEKEEIVYAELNGEKIEETRKGIPIQTQRRFDIYKDVSEDFKNGDEK